MQNCKNRLATAQKFQRGSRVKVADKMPSYMFHFPRGFEAIVDCSYGQKFPQFNKNDVNSYNLIVLDQNGKPINEIAWYYESQLTLISDDINNGLKIIEQYETKETEEF